jgi:hypothetical protein
MTVSRALRAVARAVSVPMAALLIVVVAIVLGTTVSPAAAIRDADADDAIEASTASTAPVAPTTTDVASGAPVPGAAVAGAPRVGPLDAGVGNGRGAGVWWLFGLGAAQVATLFVMTRRSRARLSPQDLAP